MAANNIEFKNAPIYIVIVVATLGSWVFDNNDDAVTLDKLDAVVDRLESLEEDIDLINLHTTNHEKEPAHSAQAVETFWLRETIEELKEDIRILKGEN